MNAPRVLCVIPARRGSTRLPRKPLLDLEGVPMVVRVARRVSTASCITDLIVATDDDEIAGVAENAGFRVELTPCECASGSDRVAMVAERQPRVDLVLNVQGDEPLIDPQDLDLLIAEVQRSRRSFGTLACFGPPDSQQLSDPQRVFVVFRDDGCAVDFWRGGSSTVESRSPAHRVRAHVGVYAYTPAVLSFLSRQPVTRNERTTRLEQFRALENEVPIHVTMCQSEHPGLGVDTSADVERVRAWLRAHPD